MHTKTMLLRRFPRHQSLSTSTANNAVVGSLLSRRGLSSSSVVMSRPSLTKIAATSTSTATSSAQSTPVASSTLQYAGNHHYHHQYIPCRLQTTARQKRAAEKAAAAAAAAAAKTPPTSAAAPPPAAAAASSTSSGGGGESSSNNNMMVPTAALVGLSTVGAAYYYFNVYVPSEEAQEETSKDLAQEELEAAVDLAHAVTHKQQDDAKEKAQPKKETVKEEKKEVESTSSTTSSTTGSRVVEIGILPTMQNRGAVAVVEEEVEEHPAAGNRVLMHPTVPSKLPEEEEEAGPIDQPSSITKSALAELQQATSEQAEERTLSLLKSHQSLVSASAMAHDLDKLSPSELHVRVIQLATELQDRTKWEAVRLKEFLAMKERETADQYIQVLQKQRLEFEDALAQRIRQLQAEHQQALQNAMAQKDAQVQSVIDTAMQAQAAEHEQDKKVFIEQTVAQVTAKVEKEYTEKMQQYQTAVAQDLQNKVETLQKMSAKLKQLEQALTETQSSQQGSVLAHKLSAAALALSEKLQTHASAGKELHALQLAAGQDGVIATAVASLPAAATRTTGGDDSDDDKGGVPTLAELQTRFEENVHAECRRAVLVPKGRSGLEGQLAGMVFAALKSEPSPDDPAPVAAAAVVASGGGGEDATESKTSSGSNDGEYILVRARRHVHLGELDQAVEELEKLQGQAAFTVADWKKDALDRIAVEKALKVIKMECALLNESLSSNAEAAATAKQ